MNIIISGQEMIGMTIAVLLIIFFYLLITREDRKARRELNLAKAEYLTLIYRKGLKNE